MKGTQVKQVKRNTRIATRLFAAMVAAATLSGVGVATASADETAAPANGAAASASAANGIAAGGATDKFDAAKYAATSEGRYDAETAGDDATVYSDGAARAAKPNLVQLLGEYDSYWQPATETAGGKVLNTTVLDHDDDFVQKINNAAAEGGDGTTATPQQQRALVDADMSAAETLPDSLGPVLGTYFSEGLADGSLSKVSDVFKYDTVSTSTAKKHFQHPRPFEDRTNGGKNEITDISANVKRVPDWTDAQGNTHSAEYDGLAGSGSFPSGHTTGAYSWGVALAGMFPQLAPEILARTSEAGNNRIVLGVHYPLDIMGGRIDGEVANGYYWSTYYDQYVKPASDQLQSYLAAKCVADGHATKQDSDYATVSECVDNLGANAANGYTNGFVDAVSQEPITDRASALRVYRNRLTYGFAKTTAGTTFTAPEGSADLLKIAYPKLHRDQREAILAKTAIDGGYPLDSTSAGWQRLDLAAALSAKVTLNENGDVVKVEPGASAPSVIGEQYADNGGHPDSDGNGGSTKPDQPGKDAKQVTVFDITDFHGHIETGQWIEAAYKKLAADHNPGNSVFVSSGDLVGASPFESSYFKDKPTLEMAKAWGLSVSALGNHELDKGTGDFNDRIADPQYGIDWVAANISGGKLTSDRLKPYTIKTINGKKVAFVGAITADLKNVVSPSVMQGVTVTDPVQAVNKVADQLSDGDQSNGEADAVVALVHEDGDTLASDGDGFDANVDLVYAGHSHRNEYGTTTKSGAPILEAGKYGQDAAAQDLFIEGTGKDSKVTVKNVSQYDITYVTNKDGTAPSKGFEGDPNGPAAKVYQQAQKDSASAGEQVVGTIDKSANFAKGDWSAETQLGTLNADAALESAKKTEVGRNATIGFINPGGLRTDNLDLDGNKRITVKEAYSMLPFGNDNSVVDLTGKQLKTVLAQQWQEKDGKSNVVRLGISSNVTFTYTLMPDANTKVPVATVTDVYVDGKQIKDDDTVTVAANSFLLSGGDGFTGFKAQGAPRLTGTVDVQGLIDYLGAHPDVKGDESPAGVQLKSSSIEGGKVTLTFGLPVYANGPKPLALGLYVNGVDFGVNDLGSAKPSEFTVTKTLTADERAKFGTAITAVYPQMLYTQTEIDTAKKAHADGGQGGQGGGQGGQPSQGGQGGQGDQGGQSQNPTPGKGNGSTGANGAGKGNGSGLSDTGASVAAIAAAVVLLAAAGGVTVAVRRRQQH
ncbi:multifunctional 2',3'-cyclic-nucleotide 2'-phosphodiesterase/5'-nucleotidase/3'-nucleotidase [Bifidobacterium parmae]|uniref:Multifunctional 2',3'-cyclic-nucleotide 2'-phosphodiesterase/5'-nucleotidase/3'-nucleotidase n=1 Tax=Bifidobacterium parmae TaxID=361854 RepID=A0A2N5J639_9BIFI|nr:multifunctional 2',3'-cyclic-nucleotide 2'-phosphodiesterase/5'-nucleotidase/3'-nucleotidase [Bifidobacterium parmae]